MPKTHIEREIRIEKPIAEVFETVHDFKRWPDWSPWLVVEPDCKLTFAPDGDSYSWEGKLIGAGSIHRLKEETQKEIQYELRMLKPWKSTSAVAMHFSEAEGGTQVKWTMDGSLPLPLFWMKDMMECLVGMDYQRGLMRLKDLCEKGAVPSSSTVTESVTFAGISGVGLQTECAMDQVGPQMEADFVRLLAMLEEEGITPTGEPFAIYNPKKMGKGQCGYTLGFPVETVPEDLSEGYFPVSIPAGECFVVDHEGPYRHLGDAWSIGMTHSRNKTFPKDKRCDPYEVYLTDPHETPEDEQHTRLYFPRKG